jgi:hypothetical protein
MSPYNLSSVQLKICPQTGAEVAGGQVTYQSTTEGVVEWWRCPACRHWHVSEVKPKKPKAIKSLSVHLQ